MKGLGLRRVSATAALVAALSASALADEIAVNYSEGIATASDGQSVTDTDQRTATPFGLALSASSGSASTTHDVDVTSTVVLSNATLQTPAREDGRSQSDTFVAVEFRPVGDATYDLSGVLERAGGEGPMEFSVMLWDKATYTIVFYNRQLSNSAGDDTMRLGESGGDAANQLRGNLAGTLADGRLYRLEVRMRISCDEANTTASGTGWVSFAVEQPEPDPDTLLGELSDDIAAMSIDAGLQRSLGAKLGAAFDALEDERTSVTINVLRAFANQAEAQSGKKLTTAQADELIDRAEEIVAALEDASSG